MKKIGISLIIGTVCAVLVGGCGLAGSSTQLPELNRASLNAVYNKKQKDAAIKSMSDLAAKQQAQADKVLHAQASAPLSSQTSAH